MSLSKNDNESFSASMEVRKTLFVYLYHTEIIIIYKRTDYKLTLKRFVCQNNPMTGFTWSILVLVQIITHKRTFIKEMFTLTKTLQNIFRCCQQAPIYYFVQFKHADAKQVECFRM